MNFPSGLVAHCTTTLNHKAKNWIEIQSERGMIRLGSAVSREIGQAKNVASPFPLPVVDRLAAEMDEFALSIMEHRCPEISGEEGLRDLQLVEAIYRSAREGTTVSLA